MGAYGMNGRNDYQRRLNMQRGGPGIYYADGHGEHNHYMVAHVTEKEGRFFRIFENKRQIGTCSTLSGAAATLARREHLI
jgi:hypothetical protein